MIFIAQLVTSTAPKCHGRPNDGRCTSFKRWEVSCGSNEFKETMGRHLPIKSFRWLFDIDLFLTLIFHTADENCQRTKQERHSLVKLHLSKQHPRLLMWDESFLQMIQTLQGTKWIPFMAHCFFQRRYYLKKSMCSSLGQCRKKHFMAKLTVQCGLKNLILTRHAHQSTYPLQNLWYDNNCLYNSQEPLQYPPGIPKSVQINCIECLLATMSRQPLQFNHLTFSQWNEQHLHQIPENVVAVAACDSFQFFGASKDQVKSLQSKFLISPWFWSKW